MKLIIPCPPVLPENKRGFTIVEVLVAAFVGAAMVSVTFYIFMTGTTLHDISSTKVLAQSEARRASDWISRDLRQAVGWDLVNNTPGPAHIKFRPVFGPDIASGVGYQLDANYIEYDYDINSQKLTRNLLDSTGAVLNSWEFNDIMSQPFFLRDISGNLIALNKNDLMAMTRKRIVTLISVTKISNRGLNITVSLAAETTIRDE